MRDGWRETTLGEVATRRKDFTPVVADTLYRVVGVQRSGWGLVDRDPIRGDSMKFDKLLRLHTDDLVYRTITAFEAPSAVVLSEFDGAFVTPQTFPTYSLDQSQLLPGYMSLLTTAPEFHEAMSTRCVGSVLRRKTLSQSAFESIPITLPPLDEQRRIVDLIAAVDDAVDAAEAEAAATEDTTRATALQLIEETRGDALTLGDVATWRSGGTPPVSQREFYENGTVRWANIRDVQNGPIAETANRVTESGAERAGGLCARGTVLVTMYGSIGRSALVEEPMATNQAILQGTANEKVTPAYLQRWIALSEGDLDALGRGATQRNINAGIVKSFPIVVPPRDEQQRIVDTVACVVTALDAARATAESLRTLRSNLLTVLLSGEHEIPASYDALLGEVA